jgi:hypothetical protein
MKSTILWDTTPCSQLKVNRRLKKKYIASIFWVDEQADQEISMIIICTDIVNHFITYLNYISCLISFDF